MLKAGAGSEAHAPATAPCSAIRHVESFCRLSGLLCDDLRGAAHSQLRDLNSLCRLLGSVGVDEAARADLSPQLAETAPKLMWPFGP